MHIVIWTALTGTLIAGLTAVFWMPRFEPSQADEHEARKRVCRQCHVRYHMPDGGIALADLYPESNPK